MSFCQFWWVIKFRSSLICIALEELTGKASPPCLGADLPYKPFLCPVKFPSNGCIGILISRLINHVRCVQLKAKDLCFSVLLCHSTWSLLGTEDLSQSLLHPAQTWHKTAPKSLGQHIFSKHSVYAKCWGGSHMPLTPCVSGKMTDIKQVNKQIWEFHSFSTLQREKGREMGESGAAKQRV